MLSMFGLDRSPTWGGGRAISLSSEKGTRHAFQLILRLLFSY